METTSIVVVQDQIRAFMSQHRSTEFPRETASRLFPVIEKLPITLKVSASLEKGAYCAELFLWSFSISCAFILVTRLFVISG